MFWTYFKTIGHRAVTTGEGGEASPAILFAPLKKSVGRSWKIFDIV